MFQFYPFLYFFQFKIQQSQLLSLITSVIVESSKTSWCCCCEMKDLMCCNRIQVPSQANACQLSPNHTPEPFIKQTTTKHCGGGDGQEQLRTQWIAGSSKLVAIDSLAAFSVNIIAEQIEEYELKVVGQKLPQEFV
eukprot:TRINITY_DN15806_c1_g2_i1.p3 TRINITY_DN15806_c1_g2~~TRINITY_DN15806_c1_g2_i1.p3  ORF type:complete len:136 (-),score=5.61 TRINITY_DN15806_c1_g2_i1:448-855(-)